MGAIVWGQYTRVRWRAIDQDCAAVLARSGATIREAEVLLDGPEAGLDWGLSPGQAVLLGGRNVGLGTLSDIETARLDVIVRKRDAAWEQLLSSEGQEAESTTCDIVDGAAEADAFNLDAARVEATLTLDEREFEAAIQARQNTEEHAIFSMPQHPEIDFVRTLPAKGVLLIVVEHSAYPWAAMRGITQMGYDELAFHWHALKVPGAEPLLLGTPKRADTEFTLVWPPPNERPGQALVEDPYMTLATSPFRPEEGANDVEALAVANGEVEGDQARALQCEWGRARPTYRYGLSVDGAMSWLDLKPAFPPDPVRPTTALFRARLKLFGRELASRGVHYEDDAHTYGYELRFAIEDSAVPLDFHEESPPIVRSVSGEKDLEDKMSQARLVFDPENDNEEWFVYAIDCQPMPSRIDVASTELVTYADSVAGIDVDDEWLFRVIDSSVMAAGLKDRVALRSNDVALLDGAIEVPPIGWNAVDAADRIQRVVYLVVADGEHNSAIEEKLAKMRAAISKTLVQRDVIIDDNIGPINYTEVLDKKIDIKPFGPFPLRSLAVISISEEANRNWEYPSIKRKIINEITDDYERRVAIFWVDKIGGEDLIVELAVRWSCEREPHEWISEARRWANEHVAPLLNEAELAGLVWK